ncbi:MAG: aspartate carbamoyltransferase catalytic subunit [Rhodobacteraceae bacterium]|nr:aspartate carbamoyltransferase catalytic subunit [Paracoccaceae bacterium]MBR9820025.1 aspartate carbamoyltransferase catalytic subunit [Paracoccaceae bacterium]
MKDTDRPDITRPGTIPAGWEGLLEPGEAILWQGRPDGRMSLRRINPFQLLFGLFFSGFALFWMIMAAQAGGFFWMFGLLHFTVGVGIAIGKPVLDPLRRRYTWYTLTDRRAFIARRTLLGARTLDSYRLTPGSRVSYDPGPPPSVHFAEEEVRMKRGTRTRRIGFERIEDGQKVFALIEQVRGARTA